MRRWALRIAVVVGLALLAVLVAPASRVLPLVRDDMALDRAVVAVALDWRDFGAERARERLQYELDHRGIGVQVGDDDCALHVDADELRRVSCAWRVEVELPFVDEPWPLAFESVAAIDRHGTLVR